MSKTKVILIGLIIAGAVIITGIDLAMMIIGESL